MVAIISEDIDVFDLKQKLQEPKPSLKSLLKNKSYVLAFLGQLMNLIASILGGMAFSYLIYQTTHNNSLMAFMGIIGALPQLLIVNFAGVIVDRFDQRKLIFFTNVLRAFMLIGFLVFYLFMDKLIITTISYELLKEGVILKIININYIHFIWPMYTLLFLNNVIFTVYNLTLNSYYKFIVKKKNLLVANSFNSSITQVASIIGPILAGMIITVSYFYTFLIGIFIAGISSIICLMLMKKGIPTPIVQKEKTGFRDELKRVASDMKVGYRTLRSEPKVFYVAMVYMFFNLATSTINGVFVAVLQGEMNLNATKYGSIIAVMSSFGVLTSLIILKIGKIKRKLIVLNMVLWAETVGLILFAFNRNFWVMLFVITIPFGFVNGGANIPSSTLRQELIPHEKLGRATSFSFTFVSIANLIGMIVITFIANFVQPMYIVLAGGSINFILAVVALILFLSKKELRCSDYEVKEDKEDVSTVKIDDYELIDFSQEPITTEVPAQENTSISLD